MFIHSNSCFGINLLFDIYHSSKLRIEALYGVYLGGRHGRKKQSID